MRSVWLGFSNVHKVILVFKKEQDLHDRKRHDVQDDVLFCIPTFFPQNLPIGQPINSSLYHAHHGAPRGALLTVGCDADRVRAPPTRT